MTDLVGLLKRIRVVPDFPIPGVAFQDLTPLLADAAAFAGAVDGLTALVSALPAGPIDVVAGVEARGFLLAAPLALRLGAGVVPVRKAGKLPGPSWSQECSLEYGTATLEVHPEGLSAGSRVLLVDDVLATGGTSSAAIDLVQRGGADVCAVAFLLELTALGGRGAIAASAGEDLPVCALLAV